MTSFLVNESAPYRLPSNIVYFHDWRYVDVGAFKWLNDAGEREDMWGEKPCPPMHLEHVDVPKGIELRAVPAQRSEPVLTPQQAEEIFLFSGSLIHEDGRYRLWYDCWPQEDFTEHWTRQGQFNWVRYAESADGMNWSLPNLGLVQRNGSRENNVVYGPPIYGEIGYHGGCVFRDPSAQPDQRYKMFFMGRMTEAQARRFADQETAVDKISPVRYGNFGAVSPDGLQWQPLTEPLGPQHSDTHNICEYDVRLSKYVTYCRTWIMGRRTIGRMETDDFNHFPLADELFWPDPSMAPHETWYANGKTLMPGTTDYHVMFPMRWRLIEDKFDFHLATSPDNSMWNFVPGGPICEPGAPGSWDGGVVAPGLGLVELPDDRIGVLTVGSMVPHKHPRRFPLGAFGWAWWPKGRLVALKAAEEGSCALWPLRFDGRTVRINFKTAPAGYVQVEALGAEDRVLPGRTFADCDRLNGDALDHEVTWRGQADLGHNQDEPVKLRFRLRSAELYSVAFR